MGQRTQTVIVTENKNGNKVVRIYHDQWGIGRKSYLDLMTIFNSVYNLDYGCDICKECYLPVNVSRSRQEYVIEYDAEGNRISFKSTWGEKEEEQNIEDAPALNDWYDPSAIGKFLDGWCDNNNGGMIVYIREKVDKTDWRSEYDIRAKWLLGHEDEYHVYDGEEYNIDSKDYGNAYERFLTADEYAGLSINKGYAELEFLEAVHDFFRYFGIEI